LTKRRYIKIILLIALVITLVCSQIFWNVSSYFRPENIEEWLEGAGKFAPVLYIFMMTAAVIVSPIPSLPPDIAAGAYFGPLPGTLYSVIGALTGAVVSFLLALVLGRELIERFLGGHVNFCEHCSDNLLSKMVFFSRLLPVVSFDVISYGAGLTKMSLKTFSAAAFFGMIPLTFMYNYFGSVLVFGKGLTCIAGLVMVVLFFLIPKGSKERNS